MQTVSDIRGLDACAQLTQLWICETNIATIRGLGLTMNNFVLRTVFLSWFFHDDTHKSDKCTMLQRLFLYGNRITVIEGLDALVVCRALTPFAHLL